MTAFRLPDDTHVSQVHLRTRDLPAMRRFYVDGLGFQPLADPRLPAFNAAAFSIDGRGPALIVLTGYAGAPLRPRRTIGLYHLAIRYPSRRDVAQAVRRLLENDHPLEGASDHLVSEAVYLADPEGNGVELYTDRPREQWPMHDGEVAMETRPLDLAALLDEASGPRAAPPPGTDLGHLHLHVADLKKAEAFFHDFLGLGVMMRIPASATFLAAGGYHHHIAVNTWAGSRPPPPGSTGLISYRLETSEKEVLYCLEQRAPLSGYTVERGRTEDGRPMVRIEDPNGHALELTTPAT